MNKINFALCTLALSLVLGGCASNAAQNIAGGNSSGELSSSDIVAITKEPLEVKDDADAIEAIADINPDNTDEEQPKMANKLYVADAAKYRGNITMINEDGSWVLEQVIGKDYGAKTIEINITENTRFNTNEQDFKVGDYVEVFYGRAMGEDMPETADAIAVNKLIPSQLSIYTGKFQKLMESDGRQSILLGDTDNIQNGFIFHISDDTKLYLNLDELKEGDKLFIYHSGITTRSLPPQGTALEISRYKEEAEITAP